MTRCSILCRLAIYVTQKRGGPVVTRYTRSQVQEATDTAAAGGCVIGVLAAILIEVLFALVIAALVYFL